MNVELSARSKQILEAIVEDYIATAEPVGSSAVARRHDLTLSSATVRNVMANLEEMGLLTSPHTSAGRVPTPQGYRMFVDTLVRYRRPGNNDIERIRQKLKGEYDNPGALVSTVSSMLSEFTSMAGVVTVPRAPKIALRQIEFLPLSGDRVLVIDYKSSGGKLDNGLVVGL